MKILITCALLMASASTHADLAVKTKADLAEAQHQAYQDKKSAAKKWRQMMSPENQDAEETTVSQTLTLAQDRG